MCLGRGDGAGFLDREGSAAVDREARFPGHVAMASGIFSTGPE